MRNWPRGGGNLNAQEKEDGVTVVPQRYHPGDALARLSRGNSNEADISLNAVPNSFPEEIEYIEYIEPVDYFGDAEVEDKRHNDSIDVKRKRPLMRLDARGGDVTYPLTLFPNL